MKEIIVSTSTFASIWSLRRSGEESEDEVLSRVLNEVKSSNTHSGGPQVRSNDIHSKEMKTEVVGMGKIRWVDDISSAIQRLGGKASLSSIYREVETIRRNGGRSVPPTLEATIRRTIEDHSTDSDNFRGVDLFAKLGRGVWGLRSQA